MEYPIPDPLRVEQVINALNDRKLHTESDTEVNVPADYDTIQEAVNDIPLIINHSYEITVDDGDYSDEDVLIPQITAGRDTVTGGAGWEEKLVISGNSATPSNVKVGSIVANGFHGGILTITGFAFQNDNPYDDENVPFAAYYCHDISLRSCVWEGGSNGLVSYGSNMVVNDLDLGTNVLSGFGLKTKHGGYLFEQRVGNPATVGNVGGYAYISGSGRTVQEADSTLTGDSGTVKQGIQGEVLEQVSGQQPRYLGDYDFLVGESPGLRIESDSVDITGPGAASDATWDTSTRNSTTVSFGKAFSSPPDVAVGSHWPLTNGINVGIEDVTTDGFTLWVLNYGTTDRSGTTYPVWWIAIGPK